MTFEITCDQQILDSQREEGRQILLSIGGTLLTEEEGSGQRQITSRVLLSILPLGYGICIYKISIQTVCLTIHFIRDPKMKVLEF